MVSRVIGTSSFLIGGTSRSRFNNPISRSITATVTTRSSGPGRLFSVGRSRRASFLSAMSGGSQSEVALPLPPVARREEDRVVLAGKVDDGKNRGPDESMLLDPPRAVPDPYGWMRDEARTNEEVLNHLKAENGYTELLTSHLGGLRETIYNEFLSSIKETDYTTPAPWGEFLYYSRTFEGKSYKTLCRASKTEDASEVAKKVRNNIYVVVMNVHLKIQFYLFDVKFVSGLVQQMIQLSQERYATWMKTS